MEGSETEKPAARALMACKKCTEPLQLRWKYCPICATKIPYACLQCFQPMSPSFRFCSSCGGQNQRWIPGRNLNFQSVSRENFDKNGVLYNLATQFGDRAYTNPKESGVIDIRFSPDGANYYSKSTGHLTGNYEKSAKIIAENKHPGDNATQWSKGAPNAWFVIDLKNAKVKLTKYVYRGDYGGGNNHPKTWELQGSNDGTNWVTLKTHNNDSSVSMTNCGGWDVQATEAFSQFKIQNKGAPNHLCCSGIEFYGNFSQG